MFFHLLSLLSSLLFYYHHYYYYYRQLLGPNYTLGCKLVDNEGFPLPVDVYSIRQARSESIRLVNDYKALQTKLEGEMLKTFQLINQRDEFSTANQSITNSSSQNNLENAETTQTNNNNNNLKPFLSIDLVVDDTPASRAGLSNGDQIIQFGPITADIFNQEGLSGLVSFITQHQNRPVEIVYLHHESFSITYTTLIPQKWSGQGLLGCKVIPL